MNIFQFKKFLIIAVFVFALPALAEKINKNDRNISTEISKISAHISIFAAELIASDLAKKELYKFRTGKHNGSPSYYRHHSQGQKELFDGPYYQELTDHLISQLADWYQGEIPNSGGLFLQKNSFRIFSPLDALIQFSDGIDMDDIIGTFTYYIRVSTNNGTIYFQGVNKMSLESYSGENYLKHGLINNPESGQLSSTTQVFEWQVSIPKEYSSEN